MQQALQAIEPTADALSRELGAARGCADSVLADAFAAGTDIRELVQARAWVIEQLVLTAWQALIPGGRMVANAVTLSGERALIAARITNTSAVDWPEPHHLGLFLANQWLDEQGVPRH